MLIKKVVTIILSWFFFTFLIGKRGRFSRIWELFFLYKKSTQALPLAFSATDSQFGNSHNWSQRESLFEFWMPVITDVSDKQHPTFLAQLWDFTDDGGRIYLYIVPLPLSMYWEVMFCLKIWSGSREMHTAWTEPPCRCAGAPWGAVHRVGKCQDTAFSPALEGHEGPKTASCHKLPSPLMQLHCMSLS